MICSKTPSWNFALQREGTLHAACVSASCGVCASARAEGSGRAIDSDSGQQPNAIRHTAVAARGRRLRHVRRACCGKSQPPQRRGSPPPPLPSPLRIDAVAIHLPPGPGIASTVLSSAVLSSAILSSAPHVALLFPPNPQPLVPAAAPADIGPRTRTWRGRACLVRWLSAGTHTHEPSNHKVAIQV